MNETEVITKSFPTKKDQDQTDSLLNFCQTFKELTPMFLKLFHKIEGEGTLPNSFYEVSPCYQNLMRIQQKKKTINQCP